MKQIQNRWIAALLAAVLALALPAAGLCAAATGAGTIDVGGPTWAKLTSLVGSWQAKTPDGKVVRASYELVGGGSALVEKLEPPNESMVTVYTLDKGTPMLTHYCMTGNQPRMRAVPSSNPGELRFDFVDATNLASPQAPHMHNVKLSFLDADHFNAEWTLRQGGKDMPVVFAFERVK